MSTNPEYVPTPGPPIPPYPGTDPVAAAPAPNTAQPSGYPDTSEQAPPGYSAVPQGYVPPVQQQQYQQPPQGYVAPQQPPVYGQAPQYSSVPPSPYDSVSPYASQPGPYGQPQPPKSEGQSAATLSLIFGIVGIVFFGIIFGPLAIWQASKAEKLGVPATAGKIMGWIAIAFAVIYFMFAGLGMVFSSY